jgi:uncharacterized protein YoxC
MSLQQLRNCNFGRLKTDATGSSGVGYQILDTSGTVVSARTTAGVYQTAPGIYAAYITFPDNFRGQILWDTGIAFPTASYATEAYNVEENDPRVAATYGKVLDVSGSVNNINDNVSIVLGDLALISTTLDAVSGNIDVIGAQNTQILDTVDSVYNELGQVSSSVAIIESDVKYVSGTVRDINLTLNQVSSSVESVKADVKYISGSIPTIQAKLNDVDFLVSKIYDINYGRWQITGNQMIFYKEDNVTEVVRFDLFDETGTPASDAVFQRVKV